VLLLSAIGHVVVLGTLALVPLHQRPKHVFLPTYTVNLVELAPPAVEQPRPTPAPPAAKKVEAKTLSEVRPQAPAKKRPMVEPVKIAPLKVKEWKPKVTPEPEKVPPAMAAETPKLPPTPGVGLAPFGGVTSPLPQPPSSAMVEVDFPYTYYLTIVQNKIGGNWAPPLDAYLVRQTRRAVICFTILRSGQIINVEVESSSGTQLLDDSAIRAVEFSAPLPPLPEGFAGDRLRVHFNFEFTERG